MALKNFNIEQLIPGLHGQSFGSALGTLDFSGATNVLLPSGTTINGAAATPNTITSNSANALAVGANGTTNPQFNVDDSTASVATGLKVKGAAAAGGLAVSVISSGTNENLTIDAKGSGTITLNGTGTGNIVTGANLAPAANKNITATSGTGAFDFSAASGLFKTSTGAVTIGGGGGTTINDTVTIQDGKNLVAGTTTGAKIGTATNQKLGFFNATPVVQQSTTGGVATTAAGSTTTVFVNTTFTGGVGATAYTVADIITCLKNLGLLAS